MKKLNKINAIEKIIQHKGFSEKIT